MAAEYLTHAVIRNREHHRNAECSLVDHTLHRESVKQLRLTERQHVVVLACSKFVQTHQPRGTEQQLHLKTSG